MSSVSSTSPREVLWCKLPAGPAAPTDLRDMKWPKGKWQMLDQSKQWLRTSLKMPDTHHCWAPLLPHTAPRPQAAGNLSSGPQ